MPFQRAWSEELKHHGHRQPWETEVGEHRENYNTMYSTTGVWRESLQSQRTKLRVLLLQVFFRGNRSRSRWVRERACLFTFSSRFCPSHKNVTQTSDALISHSNRPQAVNPPSSLPRTCTCTQLQAFLSNFRAVLLQRCRYSSLCAKHLLLPL